MKIIVISPQGLYENEAKIVTRLFENGLETFHVRKPHFRTKELRAYLEQIPQQFHNRIIIHSHHLLARKYDLKGIHYTKTHYKKSFRNWWIKRYFGLFKNEIVRTTSHTKLVSLYDEEQFPVDYIFLSPIFDSLTGKYQSGFYEEGIKATLQKVKKKVIARGGIDITRIEKVRELGFSGMALYSYIWESKKPVEDFIDLIKRCNELNIPVE